MFDCVQHSNGNLTLAVPDANLAGSVNLVHVPYVGVLQQRVINVCGNHDFQQITLSAEAKFCAVANFDGTKFRVIEMHSGQLVQEVVRGFKSATVTSISLAPCTETSWYLAAATLKNTVHVFMVGQTSEI